MLFLIRNKMLEKKTCNLFYFNFIIIIIYGPNSLLTMFINRTYNETNHEKMMNKFFHGLFTASFTVTYGLIDPNFFDKPRDFRF